MEQEISNNKEIDKNSAFKEQEQSSEFVITSNTEQDIKNIALQKNNSQNQQKDEQQNLEQQQQSPQINNENQKQNKDENNDEPEKNDLKICLLHKRPVEVICIDPVCTKTSKKCCLKCLTVTSEHSQHKSIDIDEACQNYNECMEQIKKQEVIEEKFNVQQEIEDINQLIQQKQSQFSQKLQQQNEGLIKDILLKLNSRKSVIEQLQIAEELKKQEENGQIQKPQKTIQQQQTEQFIDKQLMEIENPIQFQIAINVTRQYMKEKKNIQKQKFKELSEKSAKTQENNQNQEEKQENNQNNNKITYKKVIPEDTLKHIQDFSKKYEDLEKLFFADLETIRQDLFKKLNDRILFKGILVQNQEVAYKQMSENIRLQKLRIFNQENKNVTQFVSFGSGIKIWNLQQNKETKQEEAVVLKTIDMKEFITAMLQFDENTIFLGSFSGSIFKIQDQEAKTKLQIDNDEKPISGMKKVTSKQFLVSSISEKNAILLINTDCIVERIFKTQGDLILYTSMLQLKNRDYFVTASQKSKQIKLWNYKDSQKINYIKTHYSSSGLVYLKGNKFLLQECKQLIMYIIKDYRYIEQVKVFRDVHQNWIRDVVYVDKYNQLITASQDKNIKVWVYDDDQLSLKYQSKWTYSEIIKNIIFLDDKVISTSNDCCLQIWK